MKLRLTNTLTAMGAVAAIAALPLSSMAERPSQQNTTQRSAKQQSAKQQSTKQQQDQQAVVVGEVVDTRSVNIVGDGGDKHRLIKVQPQQGKTVVVDVGSVQANRNVPTFKPGQRIIAVGKSARINEQPVIYAMTVGELHPAGRGAAGTPMTQSGQRKQRSGQKN